LTRPEGFVSLGLVSASFVFKLVLSFLIGGLWVAVMRASLLGGTSVVVCAAAVRLTYLPLGLGFGTAVSAAAALGSTALIHALSPKKDRSDASGPGVRPG
jgi:hypothetical protein